MFFEEQLNKLKNSLWFAGVVLGACTVTWCALDYVYDHYAFEQRCLADKLLQKQALKIEAEVESARMATRAIALVLEHHMDSPYDEQTEKELKSISDKIMEVFPLISGIQVTNNGAVVHETRIRSEIDSLRGEDLFVNETFRDATIRSVNQTTSSIIGPIELTKKDQGIYIQVPVFSKKHEFLGLVQTAIRVDKLLAAANIEQLTRAGMAYELWKNSEAENSRWLFQSEPEILLGSNLITYPVNLQDNHWELTVEDQTEKYKTSIQIAIVLVSVLSGLGAALLMINGIVSRKRQQIEAEKKEARLNHFINYVDRYQQLLDVADVGFALWDKNQQLELWNAGFEKMYPKLVPFLEKGMSRKDMYALRAKFNENDIVTDWESTGTWYRHLNDGRIIMLKRSAMPDGGRLGMHVDMTASLGDQEYENSMSCDTPYSRS